MTSTLKPDHRIDSLIEAGNRYMAYQQQLRSLADLAALGFPQESETPIDQAHQPTSNIPEPARHIGSVALPVRPPEQND